MIAAIREVRDTDVAAAILARGAISADDVLRLRRQVFADGVVSRKEAETVFDLNERAAENAAGWDAFFIEALTDYFVWQTEPRGHIDDASAAFLLERISRDGRINGRSELELLVHVIHWAESCPETLRVLALSAIKAAIVEGRGGMSGVRRGARVIHREDVEMIKKLIYAAGGDGSLRVSRREAELLFDLNEQTIEKDNDPGWQDLFVRAVASHLMFPRGEPRLPDAAETRRRDRWLAERRGIRALLSGMLRSISIAQIAGAFTEADPLGCRREEMEQQQTAADRHAARQREAIDAAEAEWLRRRLRPDATIGGNERALLRFIKTNATGIDVSLQSLLATTVG